MKKQMAFLLLSLSVVSCAKKKHKDHDEIVTPAITPEIIEEQFEKVMVENKNEICEIKEEDEDKKKNFFEKLKSIFKKKDKEFLITFPKLLSDSILYDLKSSVVQKQEFKAEEFWTLLSDTSKKSIDDLLMMKFSNLSDEDYLKIRNLVAVTYVFYFQEEERVSGYELFLEVEGKEENIKVSFSEDAVFADRKKVKLCETSSLLTVDFLTPQGTTVVPSSVITNQTCVNKKTKDSLNISVINDQLNLTIAYENKEYKKYSLGLDQIKQENKKRTFTMNLLSQDQKVNVAIKKQRRRGGNGNHDRRARFNKYYENSIDEITVKIEESDRSKDKIIKFNHCLRTKKPFLYE